LVKEHLKLRGEYERTREIVDVLAVKFLGHVHDGGSGMVGVTTGPAVTKHDVQLEQRNKMVAIEELKKLPVSDPEKFMRCKWCGLEKPKCDSGICDECCPF
jgi:hypothetical protein